MFTAHLALVMIAPMLTGDAATSQNLNPCPDRITNESVAIQVEEILMPGVDEAAPARLAMVFPDLAVPDSQPSSKSLHGQPQRQLVWPELLEAGLAPDRERQRRIALLG